MCGFDPFENASTNIGVAGNLLENYDFGQVAIPGYDPMFGNFFDSDVKPIINYTGGWSEDTLKDAYASGDFTVDQLEDLALEQKVAGTITSAMFGGMAASGIGSGLGSLGGGAMEAGAEAGAAMGGGLDLSGSLAAGGGDIGGGIASGGTGGFAAPEALGGFASMEGFVPSAGSEVGGGMGGGSFGGGDMGGMSSGGGTSGGGGSDFFGQLKDIYNSKPAKVASNLFKAFNDNRNQQATKSTNQEHMATLSNMYQPGTAEYEAMRQRLAREDAKRGRRSQYGQREVDLAARMADQRSRNLTSPAYSQAMTSSNNAQNNSLNSLFAGLNDVLR